MKKTIATILALATIYGCKKAPDETLYICQCKFTYWHGYTADTTHLFVLGNIPYVKAKSSCDSLNNIFHSGRGNSGCILE